MGRSINRIATYLKALQSGHYGVPPQVSGLTNYFLDSYFAKIDERALRFRGEEKWYPADPDTHIKETWLGCEIHKAISLNRSYPAFAKNLHIWAFTKLFKQFGGPECEYDIIPFLDQYEFKDSLKSSRAYRIQSEQISIDLGVLVTLPVYGTFFVRHEAKGVNLVIVADFCYYSGSTTISILASPHCQLAAEEFFRDLELSITKNDIYFKKCLTFLRGSLDFIGIIPTSWEEIILKENVKSQIRDNSVNILDNMDQLASVNMCPNRNVILISQPGMAKTTMFRAISHETAGKATRIWCTGKSIEYPEHVTALFEAARSLAPCIIFIEDMDLFGQSRRELGGYESRVLNEFLACLDGVQANSGLVVLASTNDIASMDEALVNRPGRFSVKVEIPYPDMEDRGLMLHTFLKNFKAHPDASITKDTVKTVLELCEGLTGDYIKELARSTIIRAVAEGRGKGASVTFCADDMNAAAEQVMRNFKIGQKARKHINAAPVPDEGMAELSLAKL
jgi:AAA+ superfamily predicted ATPase